MGLLVNGQWVDRRYETRSTNGRFVGKDVAFRNWITADGSASPTARASFKAEDGCYHLYVSLAWRWAHRTLIVRALKGFKSMISVSSVSWLILKNGWTFETGPRCSVGHRQRCAAHAKHVHVCRSRLQRACDRTGALGQAEKPS
jgi:putative glutathione S-transferase